MVVNRPFTSILDGLQRCNDIHSIDLPTRLLPTFLKKGNTSTHLKTRDFIASRVIFRIGRTPFSRRAHSVLVVLADKDNGEVPQLGHIERLKHLALVARAIAVQRKRSGLFAHVLLSKRNAGADGDLSTDDAVSTKEGRREDVHRAALAARHTGLATKELAEHARNRAAAHDGEGVTPVRGDNAVVLVDPVFQANRNGFLRYAQNIRYIYTLREKGREQTWPIAK